MTDDLQQKLWAIFQTEAREHLEGVRRHLQTLAGKPDPRGPALDEAFRRAHSLKGAARAVGLSGIEALSHRLETLFARLREGALALESSVAAVINRVLDAIEDEIASRAQGRASSGSPEVLQAIDQLLRSTPPSSPPLPPTAGEGRGEGKPPDGPSSQPPRDPIFLEAGPSSYNKLEGRSPILRTGEGEDETVRIHTRHLDGLRRLSGELLTEGMRQHETKRQIRQTGALTTALTRQWEQLRRKLKGSLQQSDAVSGPLEAFEQPLRELRRLVRKIQQAPHSGAWVYQRLSGQLQDEVRQISKVPAESLFQGFRKMVRDLARDEGKEVDCQVIGLEIEADRQVLQALKDPVMHLLRNALSHGVEKPEERRKAGKKPAAQITLRLQAQGHHLHIVVEDDGRGIHWQEIAQAAVRKGLLPSSEAERAGEAELSPLLFLPGFSTTSMITDLSGRGMGLSIVREALLRLQGDVKVTARPGGGTWFQISVPLSNVSHRLLLVRIKDQTLAIPVHAIERLTRVDMNEIEMIKGRPHVRIDGLPTALYPLAHLLKMMDTSIHLEGQKVPVLVLKDASQRLALAVDGFIAEQEGVVSDLGPALAPLRALMGGLVVSDGSVVCVLNPAEILRLGMEQSTGPQLKVEKMPVQKKVPQILVVDDSITTRTLEKSILEAHGYCVRLAVDGIDALEKLRLEQADLAIVDVEMPRMDGFSLVETMKKDPTFSKIPVVMVTSLEAKKDKERGLAAGVEAYIVKGKFDHQNLLETIHQLL